MSQHCFTCDGVGWLCSATGGPADFEQGTCCESTNDEFPLEGGGCPSADGCPNCDRSWSTPERG